MPFPERSGTSKETIHTNKTACVGDRAKTHSSQDNDKQTNGNIKNQNTDVDSIRSAMENLGSLKKTDSNEYKKSSTSLNTNELQTSDFPVMNSLSVAQMTPYDTLPCSKVLLSSNMMGQGNRMEHDFHLIGSDKVASAEEDDELGTSIACRLSKRLGMEVFVSCSVPSRLDIIKVIASLEKKLICTIQKVGH